jgi:hypothetical protein
MPNRLARERSPYLLQHANNPVDWFAWGDEAFEAARALNRPIFLSIGYSTCHWCHVMEHESFEDASIAGVLNRDFVSIKVDREERPDVDRVYMTFVQATTGAGGWPMSVWLTPDLKPFAGGTYFPPTSRWGRPGFVDVLAQIANAWRDDPARVRQAGDEMVKRLREATGGDEAAPDRGSVAGRDAIDAGIAQFAQAFDRQHGGFGGAPKFPRPSELLFLLQASAGTGDAGARHMALETLHAMAYGGMRDHVGGGFHRYSVDAEWRVPHFEKMLYDQAQLVIAYLEAGQASGDAFFGAIAEDTLEYVLRDLTAPQGGFFSAEDADSKTSPRSSVLGPQSVLGPRSSVRDPLSPPRTENQGQTEDREPRTEDDSPVSEGAFYIWSAEEIDQLFGPDAPIVRRRFGIEDGGNALADPQGEFGGQNILFVAQEIEEIVARSGRTIDDVMAVLATARPALFEARARRPRPHLDDKVITAWNGLMIAAFARAARVLVDRPRREDWRRAAERAAEFVQQHLWRPSARRLQRRHRDGESAVGAFCEDYACLVWGLTELFQTTGDARWLEWAQELTSIQTSLFFDERDGGWFSTTGDDPSVLLRLKEDYDGAEPAAASVTVRNLIALSHLAGDDALAARARRTLERYGSQIGRVARIMPLMLANVALTHGRSTEIVIVGSAGQPDTLALESVVARTYLPWAVAMTLDAGADPQALAARAPWLAAMRPADGRATAYVCDNFACREPVTDPAALGRVLADAAAPRRIVG